MRDTKLIKSYKLHDSWRPSTKAPFFMQESYLKEKGDFCWYVLESDTIQISIAVVFQNKLIWNWAQFAGQAYFENELSVEVQQNFLDAVVLELQNKKFDFIQSTPNTSLFNVVPKDSISAPFGSYRVNLALSEETLRANLHQKHRNVIKKAESNGLTIKIGMEQAEPLFHLFKQTMARSSIGFLSKTKYLNQIKALGENGVCIGVYNGAEIQGGAFFPVSEFGCYYLWGGSIDRPATGAMNFLHWNAMLYFKENGVKTYDFVGARIKPEKDSKLEGIQRFKLRFGSRMDTGYLWKMDLNSFKAKLFRLANFIKSKGKAGPDIIDQERMKQINNE